MKLTQEQVIEEIKEGKLLKDFPEWCDDKEIALKAVKQNGYNLEFASERLRDDKEVVLEAVKVYGSVFQYASKRLKDDKGVVLEAVTVTGWALEYASKRLRNDKEVALESVKSDGYNLQHVSKRLKNDKTVVSEAIKDNNWGLEFASERLRDDKELVLRAVKKSGWNLMYTSDRLKKELLPQVLTSLNYKGSLEPIEVVKHDGRFLALLTTENQNNKEIVLEAIRKSVDNIEYASQEIQNKVGDNDPIKFLEKWVKIEKQQEYLNQQLDKKENMGKIKL